MNTKNLKQIVLLLLGSVLFSTHAWGIIDIGEDIELEGVIKAQNIFRASGFHGGKLIQQRNTAQLDGKYYFLRENQAFGRFSAGPIEEATFTFSARGVYDSVYDLRDDVFNGASGGKSEYKLREAFIDFVAPPFTLRLGRQQIVWGETDNFRALDIINPLDLSWHWTRESWEDIRIPLWMARGIYDIGKIGPFDESFLEVVWVPADVRPNKITTDPGRPWAYTGAGLAERANSTIVDGEILNLNVDVRDLSPSNKLSNGQGGFRFKAIWSDIEFSFNYYYGFSSSTGSRVRSDLAEIIDDTYYSVIERVNPRTHTVGLTASFTEEKFTQSIFRLETTFTKGIPVSIASDAPLSVDPDRDQFDTAWQSVIALGIDRPTWIRALNNKSTFFISTQIFWRRFLDYNNFYLGTSAVIPARINNEVIPERFIRTNTNRRDRDEFVFTFSASTNYGAGGRWKPRVVLAFDPLSTGGYNKLTLEYLHSKHLVLKVDQYFYWRLNGQEQGPWNLGDLWGEAGNRRAETVLNFIFQF
ncbi:MAG: hypothetical protein KUG75_03140 [Pseudomonadales bacterium]|nr:hypothetical protein [Pseudomonadales bacterium]